jgi:hypothetical protein
MSISSVNSATLYPPDAQSTSRPGSSVRSAFATLTQSLQAGDLASAQQAFASIQQALGSANGGSGTASNGGSATTIGATAPTDASGAGTLTADLQAVGKALQSGDLQGAQSAMAQLQQDARGAGGAHHHHHGHHSGGGAAPVSQPGATTTSNTTNSSATSGSIDVTA